MKPTLLYGSEYQTKGRKIEQRMSVAEERIFR